MAEGAPWIITLALGCAGWFVSHTVDRITSSPTLEYELTTISSPATDVAQLELTNLTNDRVFSDVKAEILGDKGVQFGKPVATTVQPADDGSTSPSGGTDAATFIIERMQPGNTYRLKVPYTGNGSLAVRVTSKTSVIRPLSPNLETNFARYESVYLVGIGFLALLCLGIASSAQRLGTKLKSMKAFLLRRA